MSAANTDEPKPLYLRMRPSVVRQLDEIGKQEKRSRAAQAEYMIEQYIAEHYEEEPETE